MAISFLFSAKNTYFSRVPALIVQHSLRTPPSRIQGLYFTISQYIVL